MILKERNRDTALFVMLDTGWTVVKRTMELWLQPDNFDANRETKKATP